MAFELWRKIDAGSYTLLKETEDQNAFDCTVYAGSTFYYKVKDTASSDWSNEVGVAIEVQQCKVYVVVDVGGTKTTYEVTPQVLTASDTTEAAIAYTIVVRIL